MMGSVPEALTALRPGEAVCVIATSAEEAPGAALPLILAGLSRGDRCVYLAGSEASASLLRLLEQAGWDTDSLHADRRLLTGADDETLDALRASGNAPATVVWDSSHRDVARRWGLVPGPDRSAGGAAIRVACVCDRSSVPDDELEHEIRAYPLIMVGGIVCENPLYMSRSDSLRADGADTGLSKWLTDLQARTAAERALRESEQRLRLVAEHASDIVWTMDLDLRVTYTSPAVQRLRGYAPEEAVGQGLEDILAPASLEVARNHFAEAVAQARSGQPVAGEVRGLQLEMRRKDGSTVWTEVNAGLMTDSAGHATGIVGVTRDITERRKADDALRLQSSILRSMKDLVVVTGLDGTVDYASPSVRDILGLTPDDMHGHPLTEALRAAAIDGDLVAWRPGGVVPDGWRGQVRARTADGREVILEVQTSALRDDDGTPLGGIWVGRDVTEVAALEAQLRQIQKLDAIGTLAGGVAHDFNNVLTGIQGHATLLKLRSEPGTPVHEAAQVIEMAATRGARLTQQLLGFARKGKQLNVPVDLNARVDDAIRFLGRTLGKNIAISTHLTTLRAFVQGDPHQLEQVIINLAINARDAMPEGGVLSFATDLVELDAAYCRAHAGARPGDYVMLSVTDSGAGMPRDVQDHAFEPFFTTKEPGKGTGMGLAMVYGIVKNHGGTVRIYSEVGVGTTVRIYLPVPPGEQPAAPAPTEVEAVIPGSESLLVVDDDEAALSSTSEMLRYLGYSVRTAGSGAEAVEIYRREGHALDLVLVDLIMPGMDGRQCIRALRQINPGVRTLLATGYAMDGVADELARDGILGLIQKPVGLVRLSRAIHQALHT